MKRFLLLALSLLLMIPAVSRAESPLEDWIPGDAVFVSQSDSSGLRIMEYALSETGEKLTLVADHATGEIRMLSGQCPSVSEGVPMDAASAKALLLKVYPNAHVFSASEHSTGTGALRKLYIFSDSFYGHVLFDAEKICGRDLTFTTCMQNGRLSMKTAIYIMNVLRPEAILSGIELDEDDGLILYEGDAYVDGVEYEFELDAYTGQLLQWDRD